MANTPKKLAMINKAFLEVMLEGDADGRIFSFPIPTYNVTKDFPWESEAGKLLLKMTAKYGAPYFQELHQLGPQARGCPLHVLPLADGPAGNPQ